MDVKKTLLGRMAPGCCTEQSQLSRLPPQTGHPTPPAIPCTASRARGGDDPCVQKGRSIFHPCPGVKRLSWEGSCRQERMEMEMGWHGKRCHLSQGFLTRRVSTLSYRWRKLFKSSLISPWYQAVPMPAAGWVWATPQASFCHRKEFSCKPQQNRVFV